MRTRRRSYSPPRPCSLIDVGPIVLSPPRLRPLSPPPLPESNAELARLFSDWVNPFDEGARYAYITDGVGVERARDAYGRWVYTMC